MDQGGRWTQYYVNRFAERIKDVYEEAEKDIEAKLQDFLKKYEAKEAIYSKQVAEGKITQEDFDSWKKGQVFQGKQWTAKKEQIAETLHDANVVSARILNGQKGNVFAINANYQAYLLEHGAGINFGFGLYDSATVVNLIQHDPQVLPFYTPKKNPDISWNMKGITRQVTLGIIEGESLDKIAKRISKETGSHNMNSMLTNARTGMTMAQNSGRQTRLREAERLGIKVHKEWLATLDGRTRWSHADLDGQKRPIDRPFEIDGMKIMYPGDPTAHPSLVYNCRCTLVGDLDDYPSEYERYDNIDGKPIKNMTYREWEKAKGTQYSKSRLATITPLNQVTIGACKTVEEVNKLLNDPDLWLSGSGKPDLTGCDLDSAKSIAAAYEQIFDKYPQLKGKLAPPDAHPVKMKDSTYAWCYIKRDGRVQVNPKWYSDWSRVSRDYENDVLSGWHPYGTTAESIVTHEIGHAIDGLLAREGILGGVTASGEYRYASSSLKNTIMKRAAKIDKDIADELEIDRWLKDNATVMHHVSEYASQNNQEWFAECFAEYITSANPRTVAKEFGKELEKLLGRLK